MLAFNGKQKNKKEKKRKQIVWMTGWLADRLNEWNFYAIQRSNNKKKNFWWMLAYKCQQNPDGFLAVAQNIKLMIERILSPYPVSYMVWWLMRASLCNKWWLCIGFFSFQMHFQIIVLSLPFLLSVCFNVSLLICIPMPVQTYSLSKKSLLRRTKI